MGKKVLPVRELYKFDPLYIRDNLRTDNSVLFEDNVVIDMTYREIILQRFIMLVYEHIPNVKIVSQHCFKKYYTNGILTAKTINTALEHVIKDTVDIYCKPSNDRSIIDDVYLSMQNMYNYLYNKLTNTTQEYCNSININDLLDIQMDEELLESIRQVNIKKDVMSVNNTYNVLDKIIRTKPSLKDNVVAKGYLSGTINPNQIKQLLASRGYITEINSVIFKYPVASSFTLGMSNIYDLAIESRAGAKALEMSHKAIQDSEYFARELQLITMIVEHLVDGDCNSTDYLYWYVRPKSDTSKSDLPNILGKYYLNEDTNQLELITMDHTHLEGKTIKLRSAMNCALLDKNKICSKCFGELSYNIPKHFNIGHYCTTVMTQKLSQSILSTKHLTSSATTGSVKLDLVATNIFNLKNNEYYFKPNILNNKVEWKLIIEQYEAYGLKDLKSNVDVSKLNPTRVSKITTIILSCTNLKTGEVENFPIVVKDNNKYGSFTYEFINHIINNGVKLDEQDRYVISLNNFNPKKPIISMPEIEYNFATLVKNIKSKFRSNELHDETPETFLQILFDLVNSKLDINIALLETMVYAFTVADVDNKDFSLGRNAPNRKLMPSKAIIPIRSLGVGYGWEKVLDGMILSPKCYYGYNGVSHPMDVVIKPYKALTQQVPCI